MLEDFENHSYLGLLDRINQLDKTYCPKQGESRISERNSSNWQRHGAFCLLQRNQEVIRALLQNNLPYRAKRDLVGKIRVIEPNSKAKDEDPVIYINLPADMNGKGLSIADYEHYLDMMEEYVSDTCSKPLREGVERAYQGNRQMTVRKLFKETIDDWAKFKSTVETYIQTNRQRVVPEAKSSHATEILPHGEAGWGTNPSLRAYQHSSISALSPDVFRLSQCILRHLFPARGFRLYQYVLFDITREEEAAISESVATHLVAGYAKYGGFNFDTAGVKCRVWNVGSSDWRLQAHYAMQNGRFVNLKKNVESWEKHIENFIANLGVSIVSNSAFVTHLRRRTRKSRSSVLSEPRSLQRAISRALLLIARSSLFGSFCLCLGLAQV